MNIDDLADNISKVGLLEPLVVIPSGTRNSYYVVSGNRRLLALNSLGFKKIDVNKIDIDKKDIPFYIVSYNRTRVKNASSILREIDILEKFYSIGRGKRTFQKKFVNLDEKQKGDTRKLVSDELGISSGQISKLKFIRSIKPDLLYKIDKHQI